MRKDERILAVKELLFDYVKSPSLRFILANKSMPAFARYIGIDYSMTAAYFVSNRSR
jgi:hypothetical protein